MHLELAIMVVVRVGLVVGAGIVSAAEQQMIVVQLRLSSGKKTTIELSASHGRLLFEKSQLDPALCKSSAGCCLFCSFLPLLVQCQNPSPIPLLPLWCHKKGIQLYTVCLLYTILQQLASQQLCTIKSSYYLLVYKRTSLNSQTKDLDSLKVYCKIKSICKIFEK